MPSLRCLRLLLALLLISFALAVPGMAQDDPGQPGDPGDPVVPPPAFDPEVKPDTSFTIEGIKAILAEIQPLVEKAIGKPFKQTPEISIATRAEVEKLLLDELIPQMKVLQPGADEATARMMARAQASMFSQHLLGKCTMADGHLYIMVENFRTMAELLDQPIVNSRDYLRTTIIHESVHAHDHQQYGALGRLLTAKSTSEIEVLNALIEGHAQFITRRVLSAEKNDALFETWEQGITAMPPGLDDSQKMMAQVMSAAQVFGYIDGRHFFEGLATEAAEHPDFQSDVFAKLPASKNVIARPYLYYHPERAPKSLPLDAVFAAMRASVGEKWQHQVIELPSVQFRQAFGGLIDAKRVDEAIKATVSCHVQAMLPPESMGDKQVIASIAEMESVAAARSFYQLQLDLLKAKDEKMKDTEIRISKAEYKPLGSTNAELQTLARKTVVLGAMGQEIDVCDVVLTKGRFMVEFMVMSIEMDDATVRKHVDAVLAALATADEAAARDATRTPGSER
ncbi:MAG: hypothetical protein AB7K09_02600 [Planctomycetota bacterium]